MLPPGKLEHLTELSRYVYETANMNFRPDQPFVGASAFAHKGGMHVHGVRKNAASYEHIDPATVGNERRVLVSELSGKSNIAEKLGEYGLEQDGELLAKVLDRVQDLENEGYQFEAAEASFVLLVERLAGRHRAVVRAARLPRQRQRPARRERATSTEATIKLRVGDGARAHRQRGGRAGQRPRRRLAQGPGAATFPGSQEMHLVDYKVRVINARAGTAARVRVVIESKDDDDVWGTVGVSENVIEASWLALVDAFEYKLSKDASGAAEDRLSPGRLAATTRRDEEETVMSPQTDSPDLARSTAEEFARYFRHLADRGREGRRWRPRGAALGQAVRVRQQHRPPGPAPDRQPEPLRRGAGRRHGLRPPSRARVHRPGALPARRGPGEVPARRWTWSCSTLESQDESAS